MFKFKKNTTEEINGYNYLIKQEKKETEKFEKKYYKLNYSGMFAVNSMIYGIAFVLMSIYALIYFHYNDHSFYEKTTLSNGETIKFISINKEIQEPLIIDDIKERILDEEEIEKVMPNCSFSGNGLFDKTDSSLIAIKGVINNIKLIICRPNSFDIDVPKVTNHMDHQYKVNGVLIKAWYYCIRNHEKDNNDFVFCVYFKLGDKDVYLEKILDTFTDKSEQIKLGELVLQLTKLKQFDFSQIEY